MQQVGAVSRFWWRAHDAPAPYTVELVAEPRSIWPPQRRPHPAPAARQTFTLEIPRGERRLKVARRSARRSARAAMMCAVLATTSVAGTVALSSQALELSTISDRIAVRATTGLIALGFGIDQVNLTGQRFASDAEIFDALDLANVRAFWQLDAKAALERIERISWVETAQITRVYPGRLDVDIRERRPAALWSRGDSKYLVDATGRVLGPAAKLQIWALPVISGEGANAEAAQLIAALSRHPELASGVAESERIAERRWRIKMKNGSRIELAAEREIEGLDTVAEASVVRKALAGAPVAIDVRSSGRIAVRPLTDAVASAHLQRAP
ncbi:MAG: cell division protein FtsQ/DivIB [Hyphomicrobium sp.]